MKNLLITIHGGGDEAVAAVQRMGDDWRAQLEQGAKEVEELRLTPNERAAIQLACLDLRHAEEVAALRGLLARHDAT